MQSKSKSAFELESLTEGVIQTEAKKGLTGLALLAQQEQDEQLGRDGKGLGPGSKEEKEEDNEVAKVAGKAIKGTAKLAGKSAIAFGDYMTGGDVSKGIDFVKSSYEDAEDFATFVQLKQDEENEFPAADHDAPKGGIGSRSMDREELKAKVDKAKAEGGIDSSDAAQIMRQHDSDEDAETLSIADQFHIFADKVSDLLGGKGNVDELRLELNRLDEQLEELG